jgi:hypothetical protein
LNPLSTKGRKTSSSGSFSSFRISLISDMYLEDLSSQIENLSLILTVKRRRLFSMAD